MVGGICPRQSPWSRIGINIGCDGGTPSRWWIVCDVSRRMVGIGAGIAPISTAMTPINAIILRSFIGEKPKLSPVQARLRSKRQLWGFPRDPVT